MLDCMPHSTGSSKAMSKKPINTKTRKMKEYLAGQCYNFKVTGIGNANHKIYLKDDEDRLFTVHAYDFQTEWDWSSPQMPEETLRCYVKEVTETGAVILQQSKDVLLITLYPEAYKGECKVCTFIVDSLKTINETLYYVVSDAYGITHMFKPSASCPALQPGDEVQLNVTGFEQKDRNRSCIHLSEVMSEEKPVAEPPTPTETDEDTPVGKFGEEDDTHEFKSTIIYPAGVIKPDIDTQIRVIVKTIAGFMNANGGTLYIGVNDNGDAIGIEDEFKLLNTSTTDSHTYKENSDGYENKLRSGINALLSPVAQDYVNISFSECDGHIVCEVKIQPSYSVVWYNEHDAYKRMGNRTAHLRSEAIVKLVLDKMDLLRSVALQVVPTPVNSQDEILPEEPTVDAEPETEPQTTKVAAPSKLKMKGEVRNGKGSFYMNMFTNGDWSWSKDIPTDDDLEFCIPINSPASKNDLIMVYADGCVNRVKAYQLHLAKKENKRYMNGRRNDGVKLLKAFHANEDDMLACDSMLDGHRFVKVHPVAHVSRHENMSSYGNRLINVSGKDGVTMTDICFVAAEHTNRVSALFKTENQKSLSLGIQMDVPRYESKFGHVVKTLESLCDVQN